MSEEREQKPHRVRYWCCWAVVALVLYVASIGPVGYIVVTTDVPRWVDVTFSLIYYPIRKCDPADIL